MLPDWKTDEIVQRLKLMSYDHDTIYAIENANWEVFKKYPELCVDTIFGHLPVLELAFKQLSGSGILDIGSGPSGVYCREHLTNTFQPPRNNIDIFKPAPQEGWTCTELPGQDALKTFGQNSFDYIQCIETMEHIPAKDNIQIAKDMIEMSRKYCFITSAGVGQHLGQETEDIIKVNSNMDYIGQPNIEELMALGYNIRLVGDHAQIVAWYNHEEN